MTSIDADRVRIETSRWLEDIVIGLNLCPFARLEWENNRVRIHVSEAETVEQLLEALVAELNYLLTHDKVETSLVVHPDVLTNFDDYNQFLDHADNVIRELELEGILQIASFHPDYQFQDTEFLDLDNFTNRSPYPMLHLLREDSLEAAIERHPDPEGIPDRNVERLKEVGLDSIQAIMSRNLSADGRD